MAYYHKTLREGLQKFESWVKHFRAWYNWRKRNQKLMAQFITIKPETEVWEESKCREQLLNQSLELIIPVTNELKFLNQEFRKLKEWKERAVRVNAISTSNPQKKIYTSDEKKEIKTLYKDMIKLPMIPSEMRGDMEMSLICNWLI
jgi:hypothetical protein